MPEADQLLSRVFNRWNNRWSTIWSLRSVADIGIPLAESQVARSNREFIQRFLLDPESDPIFADKAAFMKAGYPERIANEMTRNALLDARMSVDAASIVFAHSVLDDMALDCLRIVALAAPTDLEPFFDRRTVPLADIRGTTYDAIRDRHLERYLEELGKESLLLKVDRLHACCRPTEEWKPIRDYRYDNARMVRLDNLRHDIVHGDSLRAVIPNIEDELQFMLKTGLYFITLVARRYGVRVDPTIAISGTPSPKQ